MAYHEIMIYEVTIKSQEPSMRRKQEIAKVVPLQVMVPIAVRKQLGLLCVDRGENIRTVVLRGLRAVGVKVPEGELTERRGRKRNG